MTSRPECSRRGEPPIPTSRMMSGFIEEYLQQLWTEPPYDMDLDVVDAVNMSVNRSKYGPPEWVRLGEFSDWGVIYIPVGRLPSARHHQGASHHIHPEHLPQKRNYPHSEIWVHHPDGKRVLKAEELDRHFRLV